MYVPQTSQVIYAIFYTSGCTSCMYSRPGALRRSPAARRAAPGFVPNNGSVAPEMAGHKRIFGLRRKFPLDKKNFMDYS